MLHAVVMGDIGWPHLYHVGDEAMTEAALHELRSRGVEKITLVAADPETATSLHAVPAVPRFHFKLRWPRKWHDSHLKKVLAPLEGYERGTSPATTVFDAVHDADFVVIAGGGNLTSGYIHQMYERLALLRVSQHFGRPVFVSGQTLDSNYEEGDVRVISELLEGAEIFGLRERTSLNVARRLLPMDGRLRAVGDDGLLTRRSDPPKAVTQHLPERYIVASFERPTWLAEGLVEKYYEVVANALDEVAEQLDSAVLLIPHAGSFELDHPKDDIVSHSAIAKLSARVQDLPLMRASEVLGVMAHALCTVSTRYHPLVFGAQIGIPMIGLAHTAYTWHRMRGAAHQFGAANHILPIAVLKEPSAFAELVRDMVSTGHLVRSVTNSAARRRAHQERWWDEIVGRAGFLVTAQADAQEPPRNHDLEDPAQVTLPAAALHFSYLIADESMSRAEAEMRADRLESSLLLMTGRWESADQSRQDEAARATRVEAERDAAVRESRALEVSLESSRSQQAALLLRLSDIEEQVNRTTEERDKWRNAARSFRSEVQRYRSRRTTRLVDAVDRILLRHLR